MAVSKPRPSDPEKKQKLQTLPDDSHATDDAAEENTIHKAFPAAAPPGTTGGVQPPEQL